ncbi:hypothetical protein Q1695_015152 [Nippostrongylus brasiliensis]|nr:hypothetical protein Q1695_015152 [Nippostrongylus brasiliensis]
MVIDFDDLPPELVLSIVSHLGHQDLSSCMLLNRKTRDLIIANLHLVPRMWITNISLEREGPSRFTLSVSRNSFQSPKKNWSCSFNKKAASVREPPCEITDFYNNEGLSGLKWDKANKSVEFDVSSIDATLEEHLTFVLLRANVLCFKLLKLERDDMMVVSRVLRRTKSRVSHVQILLNRPICEALVEVIDATGAETFDVVLQENSFLTNLPFRSLVLRKAWSLTIRPCSGHSSGLLEIGDEDLLSLNADSIEVLGITHVSVHGARKLIQQWLSGRRNITLVEFGCAEDYDPTELLCSIPHTGDVQPIIVTRSSTNEDLKVTWSSSKFCCYTDDADNEGDDEFPDIP